MKHTGIFSHDLLLLLALALPLLPVVLWLLGAGRWSQQRAGWAGTLSALGATAALLLLNRPGMEAGFTFAWLPLGQTSYSLGFLASEHGTVMASLAAGISAVIQYFSLGYMSGNRGLGRYYAWLGLFTTAMIGLALASTWLTMLVAWELVGISSWGLIGFFYQKDSAVRASRMALFINKIGDAGLMVAVGLLLAYVPSQNLADLPLLLETSQPEPFAGYYTLVAGGVLLAAIAKSAQLPLHIWLPRAMEGPTPVSALLHAATMVAAGLFLLTRVGALFALAHPALLSVVLVIGLVTALAGSLLAWVQHDVKRLLAYSTVAQLGLMFSAIGVGQPTAALGHLYTHAFFKAGLFLSAGLLIHLVHHAVPHVDAKDMRQWWQRGIRFPLYARILFLPFVLGLAGVPFTFGFLSKEMVAQALSAQQGYLVLPFLLTALITALYSGRLLRAVWQPRGATSLHADSAVKNYLVPALVVLALLMVALNVQALFGQVPLLHTAFIVHWDAVAVASAAIALGGLTIGYAGKPYILRPTTAPFLHAIEGIETEPETEAQHAWQALVALSGFTARFEKGSERASEKVWLLTQRWAWRFRRIEHFMFSWFGRQLAQTTVVIGHFLAFIDQLLLAGTTTGVATGMLHTGRWSQGWLSRNVQSYLALTLVILLAAVIWLLR